MNKELVQHHQLHAGHLVLDVHQPFSREVIDLYSKPFWTRLLKLLLVFVLGLACYLQFTYLAAHDEIHFCHATWLSQQGLEPYRDYLYHNSPGINLILNCYSWIDPAYQNEIIIFGRGLGFVTLIMSVVILQQIMQRYVPVTWSYPLIIGYVLMMMLPYNSVYLMKYSWMIRPEVFVMPCVLWSVKSLLQWLEAQQPPTSWNWIITGLGIGISICVSLRPLYLFLSFGIVMLLYRHRLHRQAWGAVSLAAIIIGMFYGLYVGVAETWDWIIRYSSVLRGSEWGTFVWLRANPAKYVIVLATAYAFLNLFRSRLLPQGIVAISLLLIGAYAGPVSESVPGFPAWQMHVILSFILFAILLYEISGYFSGRAISLAWMVYLGAVMYPVRFYERIWEIIQQNPELSLTQEVPLLNRYSKLFQDETIVAIPNYQPVASRDVSYYWTQQGVASKFVKKWSQLGPDFDYENDLIRSRPVVIAASVMGHSPDWNKTLPRFVQDHYELWENRIYIRRDFPKQAELKAILDTPLGKKIFDQPLQKPVDY
jgi:hypothetical protein